jgi:hypothetical protein
MALWLGSVTRMADLTKIERWETRAALALFFAIVSSVFGTLFIVWMEPHLNVHSFLALFWVGGLIFFGVVNAVAGLSGIVAAGVLLLQCHIVSWRGLFAAVIAGTFLFAFR